MTTVVNMVCPGCGAPITTDLRSCESCGRALVIRNINTLIELDNTQIKRYNSTYKQILSEDPSNPDILKAIGLTQMKLGLYPMALKSFEKAAEFCFDDGDLHFFTAIQRLGGKRPAFVKREDLNHALQEIDAALMIENKGVYEYLAGIITFDYFARKGFNINPNYKSHLANASELGYSDGDIDALNELMKFDSCNLPSIL